MRLTVYVKRQMCACRISHVASIREFYHLFLRFRRARRATGSSPRLLCSIKSTHAVEETRLPLSKPNSSVSKHASCIQVRNSDWFPEIPINLRVGAVLQKKIYRKEFKHRAPGSVACCKSAHLGASAASCPIYI